VVGRHIIGVSVDVVPRVPDGTALGAREWAPLGLPPAARRRPNLPDR
jgi:hypothetical protein